MIWCLACEWDSEYAQAHHEQWLLVCDAELTGYVVRVRCCMHKVHTCPLSVKCDPEMRGTGAEAYQFDEQHMPAETGIDRSVLAFSMISWWRWRAVAVVML
jgi:hypothetical protein